MRRLLLSVVLLAVVNLTVGGCASQVNIDRLRQDNDALRASNEQLRADLESAKRMVNTLRDAPPRQDPDLLAELERLQAANESQREEFEATLAELRARIVELSEGHGGAILPRELDEALVRLAGENPDLMTYDPERGMVRFASDLTFALGSIEVQEAAVRSLRTLAGILRGAAAADFEVRIVGHTDNVPVTNPANRQRFEDNWGLSAFRAISVMRELVRNGVSARKIAVVGHGEHRPLVPNRPAQAGRAQGTAENRRVEIYIVRMPDSAQAPAGNGAAGTRTGGSPPRDANPGATSPPTTHDPSFK
ncbi:MAG: OmpA family protein [Phycisphaeraceae bacterium]|nr:OmpA family protein [Phycisphaeraceae bacterium]